MPKVLELLPQLEGDEMVFVQGLLNSMTDDQAMQFAQAYRTQRKDPTTTLLLTLIGFLGIAGIQRFILDQAVMGILFLLTGGFCGIGTIIDLVSAKKMTWEYNMKLAQQIAMMIKV